MLILSKMLEKIKKFGSKEKLVFSFIMIFLLAMLPFTSAVDSRTFGYSSSSSNYQAYKPHAYQSYSQQQAYNYWPILAQSDKCEATTDFLIFVRPGGCTPKVVRSDLLEEQNVPVFCKVDIVKINPLVDITRLKSVKFKGNYPPEIAGVVFHPNDEAIKMQKGELDKPLINDIGYVVVLLKRQESEEKMPDSIKVNVTAVLAYDLENVFGSGRQQYYLEPIEKDEWEKDYKENGFFQGRGYLRADWVSGDEAEISVYKDKEEKLVNFKLKKGETSRVYYMPGFYCRAGIQVKLEDVQANVEKVQLEVDGNKMWLVQGEKFLDNKCQVSRIDVGVEKDVGEKKENTGGTSASNPTEKPAILDRDELMDKISDSNLEKQEREVSVRINCRGKTETLKYTQVREKKDDKWEEWKTKTIQKDGEEVKEGEELVNDIKVQDADAKNKIKTNFNEAEKYAESIVGEYGPEGKGEGAWRTIWGAKALYELAGLAEKIGLKAKSRDLYSKIIDEYPDTSYAEEAQDRIRLLYSQTGRLDYQEHYIRLIQVKTPTKEEASADFNIQKVDNIKPTGEIQPKEKIGEKEKFGFSDTDTNFELEKILTREKVRVKYDGKSYELAEGEPKFFPDGCEKKTDSKDKIDCKYKLTLKNVNLKEIAKVSLLMKIPSEYSESDFVVEVGIEKRAIQLAPDKAKDRIQKLNETIRKWEERVQALGKVVSGMKAACLATSAYVTIKSFFTNLGGGATARQKVMPVYYNLCKEKSSTEAQLNNCLRDYNADIQKDMEAYKNIEKINKKVIELQKANTDPKSGYVNREDVEDALRNEYRDLLSGIQNINEASIEELRDLILYKKIEQEGSDYAKEDAQKKIKAITERLEQRKGDLAGKEDVYLTSNNDGRSLREFIKQNKIVFYTRGKAERKARIIPIPKPYTTDSGEAAGFYVYVPEDAYDASGVFNSFWINNIGSDGYLNVDDDARMLVTNNMFYQNHDFFKDLMPFGLYGEETVKLIQNSIEAIKKTNENFGKKEITLLTTLVGVDYEASIDFEGKRCADFMPPNDCKLLFNVCDPVLCPSSRCNLGGRYRVDNVISSGIIGSIALCLPNSVLVGGDVIVPVCLSGIHAGLDNYLGILKAYRDCLQERVNTGRYVGICDEIYSIYLCDFFWRQVGPYLDELAIALLEKVYGEGMKGGGEYLTVKDTWSNAENTINWMKNDYAVNSVRAFRLRSTEDIGIEACKMFASAKYPKNKDVLDNLLAPDSPTQFHAWFDEMPYTDATVPATSQYKVYYHIFAGRDIGVNYQVYLTSPPSSAYVKIQETVIVASGFATRGAYVSDTKDFTAPSGYKELCVRINGKDECGFGKVSTSFALDYLSDKYSQEQATERVATEKACISGSSSAYSLLQPNVQAGVEEAIKPELEKKGIVRICSSANLALQEQGRWQEVGYCDDQKVKCWLDKNSVKDVIKDKGIENSTLASVEGKELAKKVEESEVSLENAKSVISDARKLVDEIKNKNIQEISSLITEITKEDVTNLGIIIKLQKVRDDAGIDVMNTIKAEAGYYQFRIYYEITERLWELARKETQATMATDENAYGNKVEKTSEVQSFSLSEEYDPNKEIYILKDGRTIGIYFKQSRVFYISNINIGSINNKVIILFEFKKISNKISQEDYEYLNKAVIDGKQLNPEVKVIATA